MYKIVALHPRLGREIIDECDDEQEAYEYLGEYQLVYRGTGYTVSIEEPSTSRSRRPLY